MVPTNLSSGVSELMATLGSTLCVPGPPPGTRLRLTYFDRSLSPPKGAPGSRGGTSASESPSARPATANPATPVEAAARSLLRERPSLLEGCVSFLDIMPPPHRAGRRAPHALRVEVRLSELSLLYAAFFLALQDLGESWAFPGAVFPPLL